MHQVYRSLNAFRHNNVVIQLFCDILTDKIATSLWQYIMMIYATMHGHGAPASYGRTDLSTLMQTVYPGTNDATIHEIVQRLRDSGNVRATVVCHLYHGSNTVHY